jgi:hypothetical protein
VILTISASQLARITGMSHQHLAENLIFLKSQSTFMVMKRTEDVVQKESAIERQQREDTPIGWNG